MTTAEEYEGYHGVNMARATILTITDEDGTWFCAKGDNLVKFTQDEFYHDIDTNELIVLDSISWLDPVDTLDELNHVVNN